MKLRHVQHLLHHRAPGTTHAQVLILRLPSVQKNKLHCTWHVQSLTPEAENCMGTPGEIEHFRIGDMIELAQYLCLTCAAKKYDVPEEEMFRYINRKNYRQIERGRMVAAAIQKGPVDQDTAHFF